MNNKQGQFSENFIGGFERRDAVLNQAAREGGNQAKGPANQAIQDADFRREGEQDSAVQSARTLERFQQKALERFRRRMRINPIQFLALADWPREVMT